MFAAGGKTEGDELQRQLKRGADNTAESRARNKPAPAAITERPVTARPRITGNSVDEPEPGIKAKAELGNEEARQTLISLGWQQSEVDGKAVFTPPGVKVGEGPQPELEMPAAEKSTEAELAETDVLGPIGAILQNRLDGVEGVAKPVTAWDLWIECTEYLGARMNKPTREEMTRKCASLVKTMNSNATAPAVKKAA